MIINTSDRLPPKETEVLICCHGVWRTGALFTDYPTHEESYKAFDYWDDPHNEGRDWEWGDVTHWAHLPALPQVTSQQGLIEKIHAHPHPWYGTANMRYYNRKKSKPAEMLVLADEEKAQLWPSPSWADNRVVKMPRSQLQQALKGNFMLPGEEALRVKLQCAALAAQYP